VRAVDGASFSVDRGRALGIVGESGSGKSVSALTILGLTRFENATIAGSVIFDGLELVELDDDRLRDVRGSRIAMIFQDPMSSFHPLYKVGWQIVEAILAHEDISSRAAHWRAVEALKEVGMLRGRRRRAARVQRRYVRQGLVHVRRHVRARPRGGGERDRPRDEPRRTHPLVNWTSTGGMAKVFKVMAPYQPAPPPSNPFEWRDEQHVRDLLGNAFDLEFEQGVSTLRLPSGEAYWELFSTSYGPTKSLAESLGDRREDLRRDWVEFFETNYPEDGGIAHVREYLLVLGTRR
jgi:ABC-type uncharacterized transport system YnjBCD ATPase subunit